MISNWGVKVIVTKGVEDEVEYSFIPDTFPREKWVWTSSVLWLDFLAEGVPSCHPPTPRHVLVLN